jgi:hypothetical protein
VNEVWAIVTVFSGWLEDANSRTFRAGSRARSGGWTACNRRAYRWEVEGDTLKISVSYGPLDATFTGSFSEDGQSFGGSWLPNPDADETVNIRYDIGGRRLASGRKGGRRWRTA